MLFIVLLLCVHVVCCVCLAYVFLFFFACVVCIASCNRLASCAVYPGKLIINSLK